MDAIDVIRTKRDGKALSAKQIAWFVDGYTQDRIAHEQASALLMAIVWRGMSSEELNAWTDALIGSGERLDLSGLDRPTVDKHSTGGVGDKVSLVLAPALAECGAAVPMLSGRGLGHTGGTLDKLESIPGFRVELRAAEMLRVVEEVGCVICAAGGSLAPADRKLYALRDVTGTVESIPLIASSIMSKKIAEGTEGLVLDVKVGSGAFFPDIEDARRLAETMVEIGATHDVKTTAVLTAMDAPLGRTAGNALEVEESLDALRGEGPSDLEQVTIALAEAGLELSGLLADPRAPLRDGRALATFQAMVRAQGGDPKAPLPEASERATVDARARGYLRWLDARAVGVAAWRLGAGRSDIDEKISAVAGVVCLAKPGDRVEERQPLLDLRAEDPERIPGALEALKDAVEIGPEPPEPAPLVLETIRS